MKIQKEDKKLSLYKSIFNGFMAKILVVACSVFTIIPFFIPESTKQYIKVFILIIASLTIALIVTIAKNFDDMLKQLNNKEKKLTEITDTLITIENELATVTNNRDTILATYKNYKENFIPYENICNEISVAIDTVADENPRNKAIGRLKINTDRIKSKYLPKGDS